MPKQKTVKKSKPTKYTLNDEKLGSLKDQILIVLADYQSMRADPCPQCREMARYRPDSEVDAELPAQCLKCGYRFVGFSQGQGLRNEVANRILNNLKLIAAAALVALALVGCVADETIPDPNLAPDAGELDPDAADPVPDAEPVPLTCEPVGMYSVTYTPGPGDCSVDDLGALVFKIVETGPGAWYIDPGTTPLVDGVVQDVDGKCQIDVFRTAPYGQAVQQIHVSMREDDDGDGLAYGSAVMGLYNYQTGYTCMQSYQVTATVE